MPAPLLMSTALAVAAEFLPDLAMRLRGPRGRAVAETVVAAAAAAAGVSPASEPRQMIARINENPAAASDLKLELKQIDAEAVYMEEIADRDRARQHHRGLDPAGRRRGDWMIACVALGLMACVGGAIYGTQMNVVDGRSVANLDPGVLALITTVAGALLKMLSDAFAFEFGSSRGSQEKTEELVQITRDSRQATVAAVRDAQEQSASVAARVAQATTNALTTGAATAAAAVEVATKPRDFVGQLVRGEV